MLKQMSKKILTIFSLKFFCLSITMAIVCLFEVMLYIPVNKFSIPFKSYSLILYVIYDLDVNLK